MPWDEAVKVVRGGGTPMFRLNLTTAVRFKILFWNTKRHRLKIGADFEVSDLGQKVKKKGTRLKSGAPELFSGKFPVALLLVVFSSLLLVLI